MKDAFCGKLYYAKVFTRIEACIFATQSLPLFSVEKVMVKTNLPVLKNRSLQNWFRSKSLIEIISYYKPKKEKPTPTEP